MMKRQCRWCRTLTHAANYLCIECGHVVGVPKADCNCPQCLMAAAGEPDVEDLDEAAAAGQPDVEDLDEAAAAGELVEQAPLEQLHQDPPGRHRRRRK
jgi:hypothetical protein